MIVVIRRSLQSILRLCIVCVLAYSLTSACHATSGLETGVIYQAFNLPFQEVKAKLPELQKQGFTYIQVSPPQKSNPAFDWWARYQPLDYTVIESPLGSEKELKKLIDSAHKHKLKIIIDVVLNHMANYGDYAKTLKYPRFSPQDFHPKNCIDYNNRFSVTHGWLNCDLPDLNTASTYVRNEAKNYLKKLLLLGADGFRLDAAKHMEPEDFREVLKVVPSDKFVYGEVIGQNIEESKEYIGIFAVTDFHLLSTMIEAFKFGGDLRLLSDPARLGKALPGEKAITFVQNHDIAKNQIGYKFPTYEDTMLANAFLLSRQEGFPFVYLDDVKNAITKAGVSFHHKMREQPQYFRNGNEIAQGAANQNMLFIERGNQGIAMINKAGELFDVKAAKMPGLQVGCYEELQHKFTMSVSKGNDGDKYINRWGTQERGGMQIGPRDALFFVQTSVRECQ
ncbi:MAG: alpha-amylase family glycosyl hydrolase [Potamolinea sp.]